LIIAHIVLHLEWVVNVTRTFFHNLLHESRLNYVVNTTLFLSVFAATVTGFSGAYRSPCGVALALDCDTYRQIRVLIQTARARDAPRCRR
jgi:hypothetical protein